MTGCATPAAYYDIGMNWSGVREISTFEVARYYYLKTDQTNNETLDIVTDSIDDAPKIEIASGTLEYKIEQHNAVQKQWKLSQNLSVTFVDESKFNEAVLGNEYEHFTNALEYSNTVLGKTDTITSELVFSMNESSLLKPISLTKNYDMQSTDVKLNYTFDYETRKLTGTSNENNLNATFKVKEISGGYDNEQLFLFIRSLEKETFDVGKSISISKVLNWTDTAVYGTLSSSNLTISVGAETKTIPVNSAFESFVEDDDNAEPTSEKRLSVFDVTINKNSTYESGPNIQLWFSTQKIIAGANDADNLLVKVSQHEYDINDPNIRKIFSTEYNITSLQIDDEI